MKTGSLRPPKPAEIEEELKRADLGLVDLSVSLEHINDVRGNTVFQGGTLIVWSIRVWVDDRDLKHGSACKKGGLGWTLRALLVCPSVTLMHDPILLPGGCVAHIQDARIGRSIKRPNYTTLDVKLKVPAPEYDLAMTASIPQIVLKETELPVLDDITIQEETELPVLDHIAVTDDITIQEPEPKKKIERKDAFWREEPTIKPCGIYGCTTPIPLNQFSCSECSDIK